LALIEGPPAVEALLPHRDPMRLVRVIVETSTAFDRIHCIAVIPADNPLVTRAEVARAPAFLGLEAAAQAAAALEALSRRDDNPGPRLGYLVGVRDATFHVPDLPVGEPLAVIVEAAGSAPPLAVYDVRVEESGGGDGGKGGAVLLTGTISTYVPS
jgi:predicted hotdog family 3-hydroxylacyl-ACP dehydratase